MKTVAWLAVSIFAAGCGGPELLVDGTPPTVIPNGGSAQAGQVDGPTAIPITGDGALFPTQLEEADDALRSQGAATSSEQPARDPVRDTRVDVEAAASAEVLGASPEASEPAEEEEVAGAEVAGARATGADVAAAEHAPDGSGPATPYVALADWVRTVAVDGFALEIPAMWETIDPQGLGSFLILSANRTMEPVEGFLTNVIVSAEAFPGDAQSYATLNVPNMLEAGCTLRDSQPSRAGGRPAVDVEAFWPNITGVPYITLQRFTTNGSAGYVITCAAAATAFEGERDSCTAILDSFRVD